MRYGGKMHKIMDLPNNTVMDDIVKLSDMFKHPIAIKLRNNLELWLDDCKKTRGFEETPAPG